jgi:hypothetical protein
VKIIGSYGKKRIKLDVLFNYNMPIFYGVQEDEHKLRKAYDMYCALFDKQSVISDYSDYDKKLSTGYDGYSYRKANTVKKNSIMFIMVATNNVKYMEYCKKAYSVNDFYLKMLYRKEKKIMTYFQTYDFVNTWYNMDSLYKSEDFGKVNKKWGAKINEINTYIDALPKDTDNIGYLKEELSKYFNLANVQQTADQKKIIKLIEEVKALQVNNRRYMEYINVRYGNIENETIIDILKKVMVF